MLIDFRDDINYFLPDSWEKNNYLYPWQVSDEEDTPKVVYGIIADTVHDILATDMANHVTAELTDILNQYEKALEIEDIDKRITTCQHVLHDAMKEFDIIFRVCNDVKGKLV